jgi:hypothetical protein
VRAHSRQLLKELADDSGKAADLHLGRRPTRLPADPPPSSISRCFPLSFRYITLNQDRSLPNPLQFITSQSSYHLNAIQSEVTATITLGTLIPFPWRNSPQWARASSLSRLHEHRHTTRGRTPLDERSARRRDLYLTTLTRHTQPCPRWDWNPQPQQASDCSPWP